MKEKEEEEEEREFNRHIVCCCCCCCCCCWWTRTRITINDWKGQSQDQMLSNSLANDDLVTHTMVIPLSSLTRMTLRSLLCHFQTTRPRFLLPFSVNKMLFTHTILISKFFFFLTISDRRTLLWSYLSESEMFDLRYLALNPLNKPIL
jgi:hypothetical protein